MGISLVSVGYKKLGDILGYEQPNKYIVKSTEYSDSNKIPVLTAGQSFILGYTHEEDGIFYASKDDPAIIFDDFTTSNHWVDFKFKVKSSAMKILYPKNDEVNFRYCYYYIKTINYNITEHKRVWISEFSKYKVPIPPLQVQEYIVSVLDKFDMLVNDISKGLPKEIDLRQKQYEYFREKLLSFKKR